MFNCQTVQFLLGVDFYMNLNDLGGIITFKDNLSTTCVDKHRSKPKNINGKIKVKLKSENTKQNKRNSSDLYHTNSRYRLNAIVF